MKHVTTTKYEWMLDVFDDLALFAANEGLEMTEEAIGILKFIAEQEIGKITSNKVNARGRGAFSEVLTET